MNLIKIIFVFIIFFHGIIHLMGFVKAFRIAESKTLTKDITHPTGFLWLISALLFIITGVSFLLKFNLWCVVAIPAILLSQILIVIYWKDAKIGTIANIIIFVGAIIGYGVWNFETMLKNEIVAFTEFPTFEKRIVRKEILSGLPEIVQKWLESSKVVGKEFIHKVYLKQTGKIRIKPDGKWMPFEAEQWFRIEDIGFLWKARVKVFPGLYLMGRDKFKDGKGSVTIKFLSLVNVVNAEGEEIDQGAITRYLAEIIWFPSAVLSNYIKWEQMDSKSAKAMIRYKGVQSSGIFKFDENGDPVSFEGKRYYYRKEGTTLENWLVSIEPDSYKEFNGIRIPTVGSVCWKLKEGDFSWLKLKIEEVHYNRN